MLQKGFLRNSNKLNISKKRFSLSILFGVGASFCIYSLFCLLRLIFRSMEFGISNGPLILDTSTRYWQNFNFAAISLVLGNALFLATLFKRPSKSVMSNFKRLAIINDQIFLPFNFFYAFLKCFFLLGFFATLVFDLSALIDFTPLFILIVFVVFFESWKTILLVFRKRVYRILLMNFLAIISLSFLLATISVFDYKKNDVSLLKSNPKIELPESDFRKFNGYISIFLKISKQDNRIVYNLNGANYTFNELADAILDSRGNYYNRNEPVYILASYDLPISEIKKLEVQLFLINKNKIVYVTKNTSPNFTSRVDLKGIERFINFDERKVDAYSNLSSVPLPMQPPPFTEKEYLKNQNQIEVQIGDNYLIDGKPIQKKDLLSTFKSLIDSTTYFYFQYEDNISYQNYITVYSKYNQAIFELRKKDEQVEYNERYSNDEKYLLDQQRVKQKFPMKHFENYDFD